MKKQVLNFLIILFTINLYSQEIVVEWSKSYGGNREDNIKSVDITTDSGFVIAGNTFSNRGGFTNNHGGDDVWIIQMNESGDTLWTKFLGGRADDYAHIQGTSDNGFIIVGITESNDGDAQGNHGIIDYWIVKLDAQGDTLWTKCLGGSLREYTRAFHETGDSGFIIAGYTESNNGNVTGNHGKRDFWIVKLNASGDIDWTKCFGGSDDEEAYSIQETSDDGYIIAGFAESENGNVTGNNGTSDFWIVKLNATGNIIWTKCLGGSDMEEAYTINETSDHGFIIAGITESNDGDVNGFHGVRDYWIVKLNASGDTLWTKCLGGNIMNWVPFSLQETSDSCFVFATYTEGSDGDIINQHGSWDYWVVKLDALGNTLWSNCYGGSDYEHLNSMQVTSDNNIIITGLSGSNDGDVSDNQGNFDNWTVKLNSSGDILWSKCLGTENEDWPYSIKETSDSCYITAGFTKYPYYYNNPWSGDYWIIKLDRSGNLLWEKTYGSNLYDMAYDIIQADSNYMVIGKSEKDTGDAYDNHGYVDAWVARFDKSGNIVWSKCLGGTNYDEAEVIHQTSDSGFIVAGAANSNDGDVTGNHGSADYWIVKLNSSGDTVWTKCLGGSYNEHVQSIQETSDNGYIIAGYTESVNGDVIGNHGGNDFWIIKLNSIGDTIWTKCIGGSENDYAQSIQETSDNGFIIAGYTESNDGDVTGNNGKNDFWIVKLNSARDIVWSKCMGGSQNDYAYSIQETDDNGYIIAGTTESNNGDVTGNHGQADFWIVKLNVLGDIIWTKCLGGSDKDEAYSIDVTSDSSYIVAGYTKSTDGDLMNSGYYGGIDYWIVKLNQSGEIICSKRYNAGYTELYGSADDKAYAIKEITDNNFIVVGNTWYYKHSWHADDPNLTRSTDNDALIIKLSYKGPSNIEPYLRTNDNVKVYPMPIHDILTIEMEDIQHVELYNDLGMLLLQTDKSYIDFTNNNTGIYYLKIIDKNNRVFSKKVIYIAR